MPVVDVVAVDVIDMAVLMPDVSTRHPDSAAMNDRPVAGHVVVVAGVVPCVEVRTPVRVMPAPSVSAAMMVVRIVNGMSATNVMLVGSDTYTAAANVQRKVSCICRRRASRHQPQNCECKAFHDLLPIMVRLSVSIRLNMPVHASSIRRTCADDAGKPISHDLEIIYTREL